MSDSHLQFRKPKCIIHAEGMSHSGKYYIFLGHHFHDTAHECWIVGAYNIVTGVQKECHYNTIPFYKELPGIGQQNLNTCKDPKGEALIVWEPFYEQMLASPTWPEETDEWEKTIKPFLAREAKRQGVELDKDSIVQ